MIITVDGQDIDLWSSYTISTSITGISDSVVFTGRSIENIKANTEIEVKLDSETTLFRARIDKVSPIQNTAKWLARSLTASLIDSCPIVSTGEFINRSTKQIIQALALPFDIEVEGDEGVFFSKYNVELDSTCYGIIRELCTFSGLVASTTTDNKLRLTKYTEHTPIELELQEGQNCNFQLVVDTTKQASEYEVLGQSSFLNGNNNTQVHNKVTGTYPYVRRACLISDASTNNSLVVNQTDWAARGFEGSVEKLKAKIPGLRLIQKGIYVTINSPSCRITNGLRLVEGINYVLDNGYEYTELILVPPSKYGGKVVELSGWLE
jgi:prophage tail gpP-like protein